MKVYKLPKGILKADCQGQVKALAAIDGLGKLVALKCLGNYENADDYKEARREAAAQLALLGDVYEGMASSTEFRVG